MQPDLGFARWAIPLGGWFGVRVRLNVWFPLILLLFANWYGLQLGGVCTGILLVTVVIHEFAHIFAARLTGGEGDEILLWPLGGLAFCRPAETFRSRFLTPAAGPFSNALICLLTLPAVLSADLLRDAFNPMMLPIAGISAGHVMRDILVLTFALNWLLVLINLIPAFPLDGGQMLEAVLAQRVGDMQARQVSVRVGFYSGLVLAIIGLLAESPTMIFLGFFLVTMNLQEMFRLQIEDAYGGEFSESAYGGDDDEEPRPPRLSIWQQWRLNRAAARQERALEARAAAARRLDELLDKVHHGGMESLTAEERRFLEEASSNIRTQQEGKH